MACVASTSALSSTTAVALTPRHTQSRTAATLSCKSAFGGSLRLVSSRNARTCRSQSRVSVVSPRAADILTWDEAKEAVEKDGYTIVDIRDVTQYERSRIPGSLHVPVFILNTDSDLGTQVKRLAHSSMPGNLYGLAFTKPNPEFVSTIRAKFPAPDAKILFVCQEGLRSAAAAADLERLGYKDVLITEGLNKLKPGVFPKEGERELKDAGKGGFYAIQTQFSIVLVSILLSTILFLKFFPEQAEAIFGNL